MPKPTSDRRATERKHPWPMVRLGDVCEIIAGQSPEGSYYTDESCYTEFHQGSKSFGIRELQVSGVYTKKETKIAEPGSLLISVRAPVGDLNITSRRVCIGRGLAALIPDDSLSRDFLWLFLTSAAKAVNDAAGAGSCFSSLSRSQLSGFEIPLPPLSVQREIVARLERELAAVEKMKKGFEALAETAKAEFKAELKEVFEEISRGGAETRRLGDVCETITDGDHQPPPKSSQGVPFLVISNVASGRISFENTRFVPRTYYEAIQENRKPRKGDVLLTVTGSYGIPVVVETNEVFCFQRHIALIRASRFDSKFLVYALLSPESKRYFDLVATGAAQKTIGLASIRAMSVPLPSLPVQRQIVARLSAAKARAEKLEAKAREGVAVCETMRKAILKEAFE